MHTTYRKAENPTRIPTLIRELELDTVEPETLFQKLHETWNRAHVK